MSCSRYFSSAKRKARSTLKSFNNLLEEQIRETFPFSPLPRGQHRHVITSSVQLLHHTTQTHEPHQHQQHVFTVPDHPNKQWTFETGRLARFADGSCTLRCAGTTVLATATSSRELRTRRDAASLPIKVDYREKLYAVGRIPGTYNKREGAPKEHEQLAAKRIERALRPLFPLGYLYDTGITASILSADGEDDPEVLALNASSAALTLSDLPWAGPLGAARVVLYSGRESGETGASRRDIEYSRSDHQYSREDNGSVTNDVQKSEILSKLLINPSPAELAMSPTEPVLTLLVAATRDGIVLLEGEGNCIDEKTVLRALRAGVDAALAAIQPQEALLSASVQRRWATEDSSAGNVGESTSIPDKTPSIHNANKRTDVELAGADPSASRRLVDIARQAVAKIINIADAADDAMDSAQRSRAFAAAKEGISEAMKRAGCWRAEFSRVPGSGCVTGSDIDHTMSAAITAEIRRAALEESIRVDGRGPIDVRDPMLHTDHIPVVHGSSIYEAGSTQVLSTVTVGTKSEQQRMESLLGGEGTKRLFAHYSLPDFALIENTGLFAATLSSVTGPLIRHEMDRSSFIERAIYPVLPDEKGFPFTLRLNAEVLAADGGTGSASVCGGALALADAGVPMKEMVACVSIGMLSEKGSWNGEASVFNSSSTANAKSDGHGGDSAINDVYNEGTVFNNARTSSSSTSSPMPSSFGRYELLSDPTSEELAYGDMELRVAGTAKGITAIQLDAKLHGGIPMRILEEALHRAHVARLRTISMMEKAATAQRGAAAPVFGKVIVPQTAVGQVIGKEGSTLRSIEAKTSSKVEVGDRGHMSVFSPSQAHFESAREALLTAAGANLEEGKVYPVKVASIKEFGAFVRFPGSNVQALLHISEVALERIRSVEEVMKVGDTIDVIYSGRDARGLIKVSRKALLVSGQMAEKTPLGAVKSSSDM